MCKHAVFVSSFNLNGHMPAGLSEELQCDRHTGAADNQSRPQFNHPPSPELFSPLQKLMLDEALGQDDVSGLLRTLDPSRHQEAEQMYWYDWYSSDEEDIRFSHQHVSSVFLHGHKGQSLDTLTDELVACPSVSQNIPALVAVRRENVMYVILGNRRLKCYKEALRRGKACWFKVIVHNYPNFDAIKDKAVRCAFMLKTLKAMSTVNHGEEVGVHRSAKRRRS